ncbi:MAG TPA: glycosyltransferase [Candidatus Saccharimonadia bacterium]|nr:glycosyltransferase [Candidatus Saccharimonadia bacterium]
MRVLHVIPSLDKRDGGPSLALPLMARSLAMQGVSVDVATTLSVGDAQQQGITFGEPVPREGFTVRYFKRQMHFYKVSMPLWTWLRDHVQDYDLVHNHALFSFAPIAGARAARKNAVPYVMRPLGLLNTWGMENRRRWIKAISFRLIERPALEHAAAIHYTSTAEQHEADRLQLNGKPHVVPLGIDLGPLQRDSSQQFLNRFPQARGRRIVLFLSRLDPKKGVELLLKAFANVTQDDHNAILVIAGQGKPSYETGLQNLAASLQLEKDVLWTGFLDGDDKYAALAAADVFVLPSHSENFGIALVEALAAGKACIATDGVAVADDMRQGDAGLVIPCNDVPALTAAMNQLLTDDALRSRLGGNATRLAAERFSLEASGAALAKLYAQIVQRH